MKTKRSIGVVLFHDFELLDVFGPLEMFGQLPEHFEIRLVAEKEAIVASRQGPRSIIDHKFGDDVPFHAKGPMHLWMQTEGPLYC